MNGFTVNNIIKFLIDGADGEALNTNICWADLYLNWFNPIWHFRQTLVRVHSDRKDVSFVFYLCIIIETQFDEEYKVPFVQTTRAL